jgi:hypothetical protein
MGAKKLDKFGGMIPSWDPHLIPDGQAVNASNAYLFSGALNGWRVPDTLRALTNSAAKFVFRVPVSGATVATAYLLFLSQPLQGDTVTIGEYTYTWLNSITTATEGYYVLIGANTTASATNLLGAVTADNGLQTNQGTLYGVGVTPNPFVSGYNNQLPTQNSVITGQAAGIFMQVVAFDYGAAYNVIPVSESSARARTSWTSSLIPAATATTLTGGTNASTDTTITDSSIFLEFLDPDTNAIKSQVPGDIYERYYFASPSQPPQYNTRSRISQGLPAFYLGVPPPTLAPTVSVAGGGDTGTLGITTTNGGNVFVGANTCYLLPVVPAGSFLVNDVSFIPNSTDPNVFWQTVIYEDANPTGSTPTFPGALCNQSPVNQGMAAGITSIGVFDNPCTTIPNAVYWIGVTMDTTEGIQQGDNNGGSAAFPMTFTNGPPANAPTSAKGQVDMTMWADITSSVVQIARAYVYTYISAYGEEGPPSPFTLVNGWSNGTWSVGLFAQPPSDYGNSLLRNLSVARIYRTSTSTTNLTSYFQVADITLPNLTDPDAIAFAIQDSALAWPTGGVYSDILPDTQVAQNIQLTSTNYFPPPTTLQGFLNLPNGGVAGFRKNEVWFAEPFLPHAWPFGYMQTVDFPIVGLGLTTGAVVAATTSTPFVLQGVNPAQMAVFKCSAPAPCQNRGSIVSLDQGVMFMSPNGLIQVLNTGQMQNLTETWIKREDWQALTPQRNTRAVYLAGLYFCWGTTNGSDVSEAQVGFNMELDTDIASFGVWPQPGGHRIGFMPMTSPLGNIDNVFNDPWSGQTVVISNGNEYYYNFSNTAPTIQPYDFLSKKYQEVSKKNYSALRIFCTLPPGSPPTRNPSPNTAAPFDPSWNTLQPQQLGIIKVWADVNTGSADGSMVIVMARELVRNGQIMRIPSDFKAETWQVEVMARVVISNIQLATSVQELGEV